MERIGIYGGSFNPPHIGHISAAKQAMDLLRLDRLFLIPAGLPPHKTLPWGSAGPEDRLAMVELAAQEIPGARVLDVELRREGVSYTWVTLSELRAQYPDAELVFLMGTDMFLSFLNWREPERIMHDAVLGVLYRGDRKERSAIDAQKAVLESKGARVEICKNDVTAISSTDLRRMLVMDCAGPMLPPGVEAYIRSRGLYGTGESYRNLPMDALEQTVIRLLDPKRVNHVLGCRDTAVALARHYGANETDAARGGVLHDITKAMDGPLQLTLCSEYGILVDDFSARYPKTLHAMTGALVARRVFGENEAVVSAIRSHTTGKANMTLLEKIIYVADYIEPNREFPGVERLRELAFTDLDAALKLGLEMTLDLLNKQGSEVSPDSREALAWLRKDR